MYETHDQTENDVGSLNELETQMLVTSGRLMGTRAVERNGALSVFFEIGDTTEDTSHYPPGRYALATFRGNPKQFKTVRALIQNMTKLDISLCQLQLQHQ